ncbi:TatD family hydrolase [Fulvivirga sedimenti]|uniref:TatD family hydrolase n=1 Tax=Fulvivirga sedimenti TaxID=2879465 RepID=A0A9X1HW08_9BACT|nr:TatD family hydrolase [Fulvivirga sedimenti]MCA6075214.1 TatD family hydrolase [Fulvivirga sedimenti]MCA6076391.1 TatD family hydrolase [Fulvivirga sedimenti]MCA6077519.1 TatD family hydrolase [Fulvivirga sedimenti]
MIDSHAHIYLKQFDEDRDEVVGRALDNGITRILMPNVDHETIEIMFEAEMKYPESCMAMMGLHPCSVDRHFERALYEVESWLGSREFVAIGEIGTDLYWDRTYWGQQQEAFKIQMAWGAERDLPVVIHCRESIDETIELAESLQLSAYKGVFHCFTGTLEQARKITGMGFHLGIGGVATFKNGNLDEVLKEIPLDRILLETDSPYLAPVPHRGKRNEPAFVRLVAEKIAGVRTVGLDEVIAETTQNCQRLFGIK